MSNVFISVDVETSSTNPFTGDLLTVGAVAVSEDGLIFSNFYERIRYGDDGPRWDADTLAWWKQQNNAAKREVFSTALPRSKPDVACALFDYWLNRIVGGALVDYWLTRRPTDPLVDTLVFVANPSTFDFAWIQKWYADSNFTLPFSHRTMCLRSVAWGKHGGEWGGSVRTHKSRVPHHALHDAHAQALDLLELL